MSKSCHYCGKPSKNPNEDENLASSCCGSSYEFSCYGQCEHERVPCCSECLQSRIYGQSSFILHKRHETVESCKTATKMARKLEQDDQ